MGLFSKSDEEIYTCYYCGYFDKRVEASGIWHCPNPVCQGPGADWFRRKLDSYEDLGGKCSINVNELLEIGEWLLTGKLDNNERAAVQYSVNKMKNYRRARERQ